MNLETNTSLAIMQLSKGNSISAANDAKQAAKDKDTEKINAVAKDFEAMFMAEMLKPMFAEIKPDPTFGGGKGEEIFTGMMIQEYGKIISETGQIGIADAVKKELIRTQEEAKNPHVHDLDIQYKTADDKTTEHKNLDTILQEQANAK